VEGLGEWFKRVGIKRPVSMDCVDAIDPLGRRIRCQSRRWDEHVLRYHPIMNGCEQDVTAAVTKPLKITHDAHDPARFCYYGLAATPTQEYKVKVVVQVRGKTGWITTAFQVAEVSPNEQMFWEPS
jgi:hypothetical protein